MLQRVENPCTSLHDCTPSSPTTGNHYPKCDDNHSHEQSSISIIYVKLYINSITEWLSFCHLLFLLNIVKTDAGWLAWRCCWCLWPFNWPMSDLSHRYDGHFWASSDLAGTTCLCKHRSLLFPFAPPPAPESACNVHPEWKFKGIHVSIFKEMERRGAGGSPASCPSPGRQFQMHSVRSSGDPNRTQSLLPTAMTLIIYLNIGFSAFSLPLIIPPFYFLRSSYCQKAPRSGGRSLCPADSQETPN